MLHGFDEPLASHRDGTGPETCSTGAGERIGSIDVLRGVAVLGILLMNIQAFSMIGAAYLNPAAYGDLHGANYLVWLLSHVLADQKFMTIFCMLFGAGVLLLAARVEASGRRPAAVHYRRMACLILFGLLHAYLLWSGDILFDYGVCGLFIFWFRKLRPGMLIILGLLSLAVPTVVLTYYGLTSAHWPPELMQAAREQMWTPTPAMIASELATYRGGWLTQMGLRANDALGFETTIFLLWGMWREIGLMLIGMALFKLRVFSAGRSASAYWKMVAFALCIGIPVTLYGTHLDRASGWDFRHAFFFGMQFNYWASVLVSLGWIGAIMLASRAAAHAWITARLAAVGRMAFTNYIMQTLICTTIFYGHGLGLFGKVERVWQLAIVVGVWAVQLTISPLWLRYFSYGPLEWVWRSLTYWRRIPFRRRAAAFEASL